MSKNRDVKAKKYRRNMDSPIGRLYLEADEEGITSLYIEAVRQDGRKQNMEKYKDPEATGDTKVLFAEAVKDCIPIRFLDQAEKELQEYFSGERTAFTVPLHLVGTDFQLKVWNSLRQIPYGETRSYSEVAAMAGNPKACRAVGSANNKNPVMLFVPCHRVVGKTGELVGFACGLEVKKYLLELEQNISIFKYI